ncbi:MAG: hypothetical protein K0S74_1866 [Chlamydiales bacterium]|nr:hypothetical protein [Chlamydiales bacterium]
MYRRLVPLTVKMSKENRVNKKHLVSTKYKVLTTKDFVKTAINSNKSIAVLRHKVN